MVKVRLIGRPDEVEAITRDLRQLWKVVEEQDYPSKSEPGFVRRYLVVEFEPAPAPEVSI